MFKRFFKNQRGLTLVELLAVIVILGIIAAIAVPSIGGIVAKTEKEALKADAVQLVNAAKLYTTENIGEINAKKGTVTISKKDDNGGALDEYLDNPPEKYKITIKKDKENNKFIYSNIEVTKKGETAKFEKEEELYTKNKYK
jgi:type IV pilus assembly protein PilA